MKTANQVMSIIASSFEEFITEENLLSGYNVKICSERIFVDDYAPKHEDYIKRLNAVSNADGSYDFDSMPDGYERPDEMPYKKTVFIVLKLGQGEINFAVWNVPISIQVLSEENCFEASRDALLSFINAKNFRFENGIVQTYFTPEIVGANNEMYAGFRSSISIRGSIRVPEDGIVFAVKTLIKNEETGEYLNFPFISVTFDHSSVPDPQPFAGTMGATMTLNRQTTQSVSITTYLWYSGDETSILDSFSKSVLMAMNNMNKVFRIAVLSNIEDDDGIYDSSDGKKYLPIMDFDFVLVGAHYSQNWGDVDAWALTFSRAAGSESNG